MKNYTLTLLVCLAAGCTQTDLNAVRARNADVFDDTNDSAAASTEAEPDAAANDIADEPELDAAVDAGLRAIAISQVKVSLDTASFTRPALTTIPAVRVRTTAFAVSPVVSAFAKSSEVFNVVTSDSARKVSESQTFKLLQAAQRGSFLLTRKTATDGQYTGSEAALGDAARASLKQWGVGDGEIGDVVTKRLYAQDGDTAAVAAPELHRYKTFITRRVNGVPVAGHRAVITHGKDGAFQRALVVWPALAATGHKLTTKLSDETIASRTKTALAAHGVSDGTARLRYKYLPTLQANGEATLRLVVGARIKAASSVDGGEAHEVDVDVDAE